ncbi:hypothetical protein [Desulfovibrio porci]|uniref:hypothetical protein n=1 Tax=Desulfovibrio porci TaxID=2605782 RepID=UPI003A9180BF
MTRHDLPDLVVEALKAMGGAGRIVQICKYIWEHHKDALSTSGDLFYTWQYDVRWAGQRLRDNEVLEKPRPDHVWRLREKK